MTPIDAVFLAVALALFLPEGRSRWLAALMPPIAFGCGLLPLGGFHLPVVALLACLFAPRHAPIALALALPAYGGLAEALRAAVAWPLAVLFLEGMAERLDEAPLLSRAQGMPVRLVTCGVLYYIWKPFFYL